MGREGLTARQVQYIKPHPAKRLEIPAGPPSGLYLVVHSSGKKSWALRYRWHGRPSKLTFSKPYPDLTLAAARAEAEAALASIKSGVDPAAEKAAEESKPDAVQAVVEVGHLISFCSSNSSRKKRLLSRKRAQKSSLARKAHKRPQKKSQGI